MKGDMLLGRLGVVIVVTAMMLLGLAGSLTASAADAHDFIIKNYLVDMLLARDDEGRSRLRIKETITAVFPEFDQNQGVERSMVSEYKGRSIGLRIESVTKPDGSPWEYKINEKDIMRIGSKDVYLHGEQTFIVEYSMQDVTSNFNDMGLDEFGWDAIGAEWRVPIDEATVSLVLSKELADRMVGQPECYAGPVNTKGKCSQEVSDDEKSQKHLVFGVKKLGPREGVTVAVGFLAGTFAEYQPSLIDRAVSTWKALNFWSIIPIGLAGLALSRIQRKKAMAAEIRQVMDRAVVPQYIPPSGYNILASSQIFYSKLKPRALPAHIIDWAVQHYVAIRQTAKKRLFSKAKYDIEIVREFPQGSPLRDLAGEIFNGRLAVGSVVSTDDLQKRAQVITDKFQNKGAGITESSLFYKNHEASVFAAKASKILLIISIVTLTIPTAVLALTMYILKDRRFISREGAELKRYLQGLKLYISVAEVDRLKMLQSPEALEQVGDVISDKSARLRLYERTLPYAILFRQEKGWAKRLSGLYADTGQDAIWSDMAMASGFSHTFLVSGIGGFTANISAASGHSSSTSLLGGGGSVGGGGGGGGGGGW